MALDEALFHYSRITGIAVARFYHWERPALTFGYSEAYPQRVSTPAIRRFTGGGLVEHGSDVTFLLTFPASSGIAKATAADRYARIHGAIVDALAPLGFSLRLNDAIPLKATGPCFERPVLSDLIAVDSGEKIGGGAQRRSRGAVIHQGSIRLPQELRERHAKWSKAFLSTLSEKTLAFPAEDREEVLREAGDLHATRYLSRDWNHRR